MILTVIKTTDAFIGLEDEWNNLLEEATEDNPFQSHQWLLTWWRVYGTGQLHVVTCREDESGRLMGALPLYKLTIGALVPLTVLQFLGSGKGSADFLGCIARKGSEREVYEVVIMHLLEGQKKLDLIELQNMDAAASFSQFIQNLDVRGLKIKTSSAGRCPYLQLPDTWEEQLKGLSKKVRQRVSYYRRALDKIGTVELEQITDVEMLPGALTDMIRLRQDRLDQKGLSSNLVTDAYRNFHEQLMPAFLKDNRLQLCFLRLDGQRIAYMYLFTGGKSIYFYQTGFDRTWSNQSVGFVLLGRVIEQAIADGYENFEFLRGEEKYKYEWGNVKNRELFDVSIVSWPILSKIIKYIFNAILKIKS